MPVLFLPEIESYANRDPLLYEILLNIMNAINTIPISSGQGSPDNIVPTQDPIALYIQRDSSNGPQSIWIKDHDQPSPTDIPTTFKHGWARVGGFGATSPFGTGGFAWVVTTTTITFYWDGTNGSNPLNIYFPANDEANPSGLNSTGGNAIIGPLKGNQLISGLLANTTYRFYPFYNHRLESVGWLVGGVGVPAFAFTSVPVDPLNNQKQWRPWYIPLSAGAIVVTTPNAGSTAGSAAGGGPFGKL